MDDTLPPTRRSRIRASVRDVVELLGAVALGSLMATAWLLVRSQAGRDDLSEADALLAAAIVLAIPPAWFVRYAVSSLRESSPGERALSLEVRGPVARRALRITLHPMALPAWTSLVLLCAAAGAPVLASIAAAAGVLVAVGGLASAALLVSHPASPALHDRIAGTRLVLRGRRAS